VHVVEMDLKFAGDVLSFIIVLVLIFDNKTDLMALNSILFKKSFVCGMSTFSIFNELLKACI